MIDYKCNEIRRFEFAQEGLFGVEVEVEGHNLPKKMSKYWKVIKDGSLRGESAEYIFARAFNLETAKNAITYLNESLKDSILNMSFRTSVHVHVNIQHLTKSQFNRFLYLSFLVEDLLVEFSGEGRIGNRFCLRVRDAEEQLTFIQRIIGINNQLIRISPDEGKYAAINLCTASTYGSVEFRSMQGTTNAETLFTWLDIINSLYVFAKDTKYSLATIGEKAITAPKAFMKGVFGDKAKFLMFKGYEYALSEAEERMIGIPLLEPVWEERNRGEDVKEKAKVDYFDMPIFNAAYAPIRQPIRNRVQIIMDELVEEEGEIDREGDF